MCEFVSPQIENQVATITIQNGKVNAISHQVLDELNQGFDQAEKAQAVVVLAGRAGMFSGGFDLQVMRGSTITAMALVEKGYNIGRKDAVVSLSCDSSMRLPRVHYY
jgi:enoyl-CoA hydratase